MEKTVRILILDESDQDVQNIITELRNSAIPVLTERACTREDMIKACEEFKPDLILSDYALINFDGLSAMEFVRRKYPEIPFIFVSWVIHEQSVIDTLKKGGTDYVFKDQLSRLPLSVHRAMREADERRQLRQTQKKIIEQERLSAIGQMSSGIAHDFSNALMPVLGFAEILLQQPDALKDEAKTRKYLGLIHTSAHDAMNIVGRLREFYRSKEKAEALHPVSLNEVIRQTVLLTQPRWREEQLERGIEIHIHEELGNIPEINGNESALREAMTNMIFNAVDALPKGGSIFLKTVLEGSQVLLAISDTGMGMNDETARHCFEPFFSTKGRGGTGLGLSMVYGIVKRHEASIEVKSELNEGTTFTLRFPVRKTTEAAAGDGKNIPPGAMLSRKLRVLVVDDEAAVREVLTGYLALDGHSFQTAADGKEGLELFQKNKFDLVITDRAMPEMNGDRMTEKIKEIDPAIPVIMITGFGELMKVKGEHPKGVDVILSKPLTISICRETVAGLFAPHS